MSFKISNKFEGTVLNYSNDNILVSQKIYLDCICREYIYYPNGQVKYEKWYKYDYYHRDGDAAFIQYLENGQVIEEQWYKNGKIHRKDNPALIKYDDIGNVIKQCYYKNGEMCRFKNFFQKVKLIF